MTISILGAGSIGQALARNFVRAKLDVLIANRSGTDGLAKLGPNVQPASMAQALAAEVVILAVPFQAVASAVADAPPWKARLVIDATNALDLPGFTPSDLGGRMSTHVVAEAVPGARVVKAFNTLPAAVLGEPPSQGNRRRVLFVSGDDEAANKEAAELIDQLGFAPIILGKIAEGGRLQQFGGPLTVIDLARR